MLHHRFHLACDVYQQVSPAINLLATMVTVTPAQETRLAWSFITFAEADPWQPIMRTSTSSSPKRRTFTAGGHRYAVFAHDWRVETFDAWWEREAERSQARHPEPELTIRANAAPIVVLSESEFAQSVRQALRDYTRPASLSANLLLRSRVAMDVAGAASADALAGSGRASQDQRPGRKILSSALVHVTFSPPHRRSAPPSGSGCRSAPTATTSPGTARVVAWLWQREVYG